MALLDLEDDECLVIPERMPGAETVDIVENGVGDLIGGLLPNSFE